MDTATARHIKRFLGMPDAAIAVELLARISRENQVALPWQELREFNAAVKAWDFIYQRSTDTHGFRDIVTANTPAWCRP